MAMVNPSRRASRAARLSCLRIASRDCDVVEEHFA